jgi:hypothetical protein
VIREVLYFISNICFAAIMAHDSGKSIAENDTKLTDLKVFMEAMMSEMRRVMKIVMQAKELDMLIIHMGMDLNLDKTLCHFLVAQLQDLEPNVSRKH